MKILSVFLAFYFSLLSCSLYSGTIDPAVADDVYVQNANSFPYVGKLCGTYEDGTHFCASAVAISERWILTAAHVVKGANKCKLIINDKEICVGKFIYKKEFDANELGKNDIAIGHCDENIGLNNYPLIYEKDDEVGKKCYIAGYGITGTFISGAIKSDNKKRAGTNVIDSVYRDTLLCTPSRKTEDKYTSSEFLIASGDSGGGLFIDGKLAGINSFVMAVDKRPNSSYTDEACHTRVSLFREWIEDVTK